MTHKRSWLALGALLAAIIGGTVWAAEQEKKAPPPAYPQGVVHFDDYCDTPKDKKCCDEKCCTKDEAKTCCEGKGCTDKKDKGCCADGKCCGCCEKSKDKQVVTLPVTPGSSIQVVVAPPTPGMAYDLPIGPPAPPAPCVGLPQMPAQGCGSSWAASTVPQAAQPMQYAPVAQCVPTAYPVTPLPPPAASPTLSPWQLRVVVLNNHPRLLMQWDGDKDTRLSCDEMVLHIGPEPLKVVVEDKQIRVSGNFLKGSADTISRNTADGSLLLEGHVKMHYGKEGKKVEVAAEQVVVGITDGRVEVRGLGRAATPEALTAPKEIRPTSTAPTSCPLCPASSDERHHIFNFWMGLFR